jgi:hypothetical protein
MDKGFSSGLLKSESWAEVAGMSRLTPLEQSTHPVREIELIHLHESIHRQSKTIQIKKHERLMTSCERAAGQKQVGNCFFLFGNRK